MNKKRKYLLAGVLLSLTPTQLTVALGSERSLDYEKFRFDTDDYLLKKSILEDLYGHTQSIQIQSELKNYTRNPDNILSDINNVVSILEKYNITLNEENVANGNINHELLTILKTKIDNDEIIDFNEIGLEVLLHSVDEIALGTSPKMWAE